jgi:hypothetical protein
VKLLPLARDEKARGDLFTQIKALRKEVEEERQLKDQQEVAQKVIDFQNDPSKEGELLALLAEKAKNGKTDTEINRYVTLASQVVARARQLQQDALRGSGSGGGSGGASTAFKKAVDAMMQPARNNYDDAVDRIQKIIRDGRVPTADEWAIFWAAGDRVRTGADLAISKGAAGTVLDGVLKEIRQVDEQRDTQRKAAGQQVITQANDLLSAQGERVRGLKRLEDVVDAVSPTVDQIKALAESGYLTQAQRDDMIQKVHKAEQPVRDRFNDAVSQMRDPTLTASYKLARTEYDKYLRAYEEIHGNLSGAADFDRWKSVIGNESSTVQVKGTELGVFTAGEAGGPFQAAGEGKWGSGSYNADNITAATAIKRAAREESNTLSSDVETGGKLLRPGWLVEEIIDNRPSEAGRAQRQAGLFQLTGVGPTPEPSPFDTAAAARGDYNLPDIDEMRASNAAAARQRQVEPEVYPEDQIMAGWNPTGPNLDPGITGGASIAGPGVFNPQPQQPAYDPYGPSFDPGVVEPQPFSLPPVDELRAARAAQQQPQPQQQAPQSAATGYNPFGPSIDPGFIEQPSLITSSAPSWLDAFNFLDAGAVWEFPTFTLPDLNQRSSFSMPSYNLEPIPYFPDMSQPFLTAGDEGGRAYTEITPPEPSADYVRANRRMGGEQLY